MPRRATSTSYGGKDGNNPRMGRPGPGRPPQTFVLAMQHLASRTETYERLEKELENEDPHVFLKAFSEVADRGFGRAPQLLEHTGGLTGMSQEDVERKLIEILAAAKRRKESKKK